MTEKTVSIRLNLEDGWIDTEVNPESLQYSLLYTSLWAAKINRRAGEKLFGSSFTADTFGALRVIDRVIKNDTSAKKIVFKS